MYFRTRYTRAHLLHVALLPDSFRQHQILYKMSPTNIFTSDPTVQRHQPLKESALVHLTTHSLIRSICLTEHRQIVRNLFYHGLQGFQL